MRHKAAINGLTMDPDTNAPIVVLKTEDTDQVVPIWIGLLEATAIASALRGVSFDRPMTHDLMKNVMENLGAKLLQVEVTDIVEDTFYARLTLSTDRQTLEVDSRPSDAIALALRFSAPIYVSDRVIEKSGRRMSAVEAADDSEEGKKWREYLEKLDPTDFGKYKV